MLSILITQQNEAKINDLVQEIEDIIPATQIIIINDRDSRGKGWAIRQALWEAKGDYIAFIDGDGDIKPRMLWRLIPFLEDYDIVVGSKKIWKAPFHRKLITHLSRFYIRLFFGVGVDTQTGLKLFRREAIPSFSSNGFIFDVEILAKAKKAGAKIIEIPIEAEIKCGVSLKALWRTLTESITLWSRL